MEINNPTIDHFSHTNIENPRDFNEDDVFYAELRRQVLLLIAEDDEEYQGREVGKPAKSSQQQRWLNTTPVSTTIKHGCYYHWSGHDSTESVPKWIFDFWRAGNGTGVFIPQVVDSRTRRPRRRNNERRMYKQVRNAGA